MAKKKEQKVETKRIRVTLVKSPIRYNKKQRVIAQSLGLRKLNASVVHYESPQIRGMINKIPHLLKVEEVEGE